MTNISKNYALGFQVLIWSLVSLSTCFSQLSLSVDAPLITDWCKPVSYTYIVENDGGNSEAVQLSFEFSQDVTLVSADHFTSLSANDTSTIILDLPDASMCSFISGTLTVLPDCKTSLFSVLDTKVSIIGSSTLFDCKDYRTTINGSFLTIKFDPYEYISATNHLEKSISITNISTSDVSSFDISLDIANDFAVLSSSSAGSILSSSTLSFNPSDLPGGSLSRGETLTVDLGFALESCEIASIRYDITLTCDISDCFVSTPFVDDNQIQSNDLALETSTVYAFGICDPAYNPITLFNNSIDSIFSISDAYNVSFLFSYRSRTPNTCQELDFIIGDQRIDFEGGDSVHIVSFDQFDADPDGPGGISDLDGDGQFDDLAAGDSISLAYGVRIKQECVNQLFGFQNRIVLRSEYLDICDNINEVTTFDVSASNPIFFDDRSWTHLPKDETGNRFINVGDSIEWLIDINFGFPSVYINCQDPNYELSISTPPNLRWIESEKISFIDRTDSSSIDIPYEIRDSLIVLDVTDLSNGYLRINFEGICPDDALVDFDQTEPLYNQCLEWQDYSVEARLNILCDFDPSCEPVEHFRDVNSTFIRTTCLDLQQDYNVISTPGPIVDRFNGGWMDDQQTIKWDPDIHRNSANNFAYYDHDTMRVRVPFTINHADVLEGLKISYGNRLNQQEIDLEMISSNISSYDKITGQLIGSCDVRSHTTDLFKTTSLDIDMSDFNSSCIAASDSMVWELMLELNVERSPNLERSSFAPEDTKFTLAERVNNCSKITTTVESQYWVSEVFIPQVFDFSFNRFSFRNQFNINSTIPVQIGLQHSPLIISENTGILDFIFEQREQISFNTVTYNIPEGYEFENEELLIVQERDTFILTETSYLFYLITDTLAILSPSNQSTQGTGTEYTFDIPQDLINTLSIDDDYTLKADINLVCPTPADNSTIVVSGNLDYVDYYTGSLEVKNFDFSLSKQLTYIPYDYDLVDDFQINSNSSLTWDIIDIDNFFPSNIFNESEEEFILEYNAQNIKIDSVKYIFEFTHIFENTPPILQIKDIPLTTINDNTFSFNPSILPDTTPSFTQISEKRIQLYTSNHSCGYDSLIYSIGNKSLWDRNLCLEAAYSDTIVSYTPVGIPNLELQESPSNSTLCEPSFFSWIFENFGQGGLTDVILSIEGPELGFPNVTVDREDGRTISTLVPIYENGAYSFSLSAIGIDTIHGVLHDDHTAYDLLFSWLTECETPSLVDITLSSTALNFCGERISSSRIRLPLIPLIVENQPPAIGVEVFTYTENQCNSDIKMRAILDHPQMVDIVQDSLIIILPQDAPYISGSTTINGLSFKDPIITTKNREQYLIWTDIISSSTSVSTTVDFILDSSCTNECGIGEVQAFIFSHTNQICVSNENIECPRSSLRGSTEKTLVHYRPRFQLEISNLEIISTDMANTTIGISSEITEIRGQQFTGDIFYQYYIDTNQNGVLENDELIVSTSSDFKSDNQSLIHSDTISVPNEFLCNLSISINPDPSCACFNHSALIDFTSSSFNDKNILVCSEEILDLSSYFIDGCVPTWTPHPRLTITGSSAQYDASLDGGLSGTDTILYSLDCAGCFVSDTLYIGERESLEVIYTGDICDIEGRRLAIDVEQSNAMFTWDDGYPDRVRPYESPASYPYTIVYDNCIFNSSVETTFNDINLEYANQYQATKDISTAIEPIRISNNTLNIKWDNSDVLSCTDCPNPNITTSDLTTLLTVTITSDSGCEVIQEITVNTQINKDLYIPNVFSPTSDINNIFFPANHPSIESILVMNVFDRWGNKMHSRTNISADDESQGWNGTIGGAIANTGVYVYHIEILLIDGDIIEFTGTVTML